MNNEEYLENRLRNTVMYSAIKDMLAKINTLPYVIIKGAPLSNYLYGDPNIRKSVDIDILTDLNTALIIEKIFLEYGFMHRHLQDRTSQRMNRILCLNFSHQLPPLYNKSGTCNLDINHSLFWGEYKGLKIDIIDFISDAVFTEFYGCRVKTLSYMKMFIQFALHTYRDMNSIFLLSTRRKINATALDELCIYLKQNNTKIELNSLYKFSIENQIDHYIYYILYHMSLLCDDPIVKIFSDTFRSNRGELLLNQYGLNEKRKKYWHCNFSERLQSEDVYELIKTDLEDEDLKEIALNKKIFLGIEE